MSTWFLARSFITIGTVDLWEMGAGNLCDSMNSVFGCRWNLVRTACKQRADSLVGLSVMGAGFMLQAVALLLAALGAECGLSAWTLPFAGVPPLLAWGIGRAAGRAGAARFLKCRIRDKVVGEPRLTSDRDKFEHDVEQLLEGWLKPKQLQQFVSALVAKSHSDNTESTG